DMFSFRVGDKESRSKDVLGRVYEYFLGKFASAEGKGGGEFYTPMSVVKLLVEMLEPYKGRIYDIILQRLIQFNYHLKCSAYKCGVLEVGDTRIYCYFKRKNHLDGIGF